MNELLLNVLLEEKTLKKFLKKFLVIMLREVYRSLAVFLIVEFFKFSIILLVGAINHVDTINLISLINKTRLDFLVILFIYCIFEHGGGKYTILAYVLILYPSIIKISVFASICLFYLLNKVIEKSVDLRFAKRKKKVLAGESAMFYFYIALYILYTENLNNIKYVLLLLALFELIKGYTDYLYEIYMKKSNEESEELEKLNKRVDQIKKEQKKLKEKIKSNKEKKINNNTDEDTLEKVDESNEKVEELQEEIDEYFKKREETDKILKLLERVSSINMHNILRDLFMIPKKISNNILKIINKK